MMAGVFLLSVLGGLTSIYAIFIEKKLLHEPGYKPFCDLSDRIACSTAILSRYGKLLGIPNGYIGFGFYLLMATLAILNLQFFATVASIVGLLLSFVLVYVQYCVLGVFCLVCTLIYCINIMLVLLSYYGY